MQKRDVKMLNALAVCQIFYRVCFTVLFKHMLAFLTLVHNIGESDKKIFTVNFFLGFTSILDSMHENKNSYETVLHVNFVRYISY